MLNSSVAVAVISLLGSLTSFLNQVILARLFGASPQMDAYQLAVSIPATITGTLTAAISYFLIPILLDRKRLDNIYEKYYGMMLIIFITLSALILISGLFLSPFLISILEQKRLSQNFYTSTVLMMRIAWASGACAIIVGYLSCVNNASKHYYLPAFVGLIPSAFMLLFGLLWGKKLGPSIIVIGMLYGTALSVLVLMLKVRSEICISLSCFINFWQVIKQIFKTPVVMLAMFCFTIYQAIDAYWAPKLGPGNLAYLGYCQRIVVAISTLIIAGPSTVLVPRLTEIHQNGQTKDFLHMMLRVNRLALALGSFVCIVVSILAKPIVEVLFKRGAFGVDEVRSLAGIIPVMLSGMVAMICVVLMFRAIYAKQDMIKGVFLGLTSSVLYFILSGILSHFFLLRGIAFAYTLTWWIVLILTSIVLWNKQLKLLISFENLFFVIKIVISLLVSGLIVYLLKSQMILPIAVIGWVSLFVRLLVIGCVALIAFGVMVSNVLNIPDVKSFFVFAWIRVFSSLLKLKSK